jgi:hypothetical protein
MTNLLKKLVPNGKDHTLEVPKYEGDITNLQAVSAKGDGKVLILSPSPLMSKTEALVHAAWIVAIADQSENFEEFRRVLKAVLET